MSEAEKHEKHQEHQETALGEVLREIEDAETRTPRGQAAADRRHSGEAGDAITPNAHAQREAEDD
ncbi:hypothetical protein [Streptomyces sp. H51]|uniref:hypothetical protein n=1 Tax=Streptomyces sp. H51 TaxID=3111770 RepID=UPI002D77C2EF|nr:hypothetical protein [Streptomyces sp. H51]